LLSEDLLSVKNRERYLFDQLIEPFDGQFVLFGAGSLCRSALRCLTGEGRKPLAIADNNPSLWNTRLNDVPILSPSDAARQFGSVAAFFVTIWNTGHRYVTTREQLERLGCQHVYPAAALRWKFADNLLPFFLQDLPSKVYEAADKVRAAFLLWSDERSRKEYVDQIRYRALGDYSALSAPDAESSYFLDTLYSLDCGEVFIDCGAYDGDTIREVLKRQPNVTKIIAFEPDPQNFNGIERLIASLPESSAVRVKAFPYGLSSKRDQLRFSATGDLGSKISDAGNMTIEVVTLDKFVYDLAPTFIKMDIEGAETDALAGSEQTIKAFQPLLSICLYHRQNDLWQIPLWIHSANPEYKHFLRTHETDGWQTVGYAVPSHRLKPAAL
jgi:FkbM family methyltransferase